MKINQLSLINRLILAVVSGALVIPISSLESFNRAIFFITSLIDFLIGTVFALLVMTPFQKPIHWLKIILMVIASIAIYVVVSRLAQTNYQLFNLDLSHSIGIMVSGALGALLTGICVKFLAPIQTTYKTFGSLIVVGFIAGFVFSYTIDSNSLFINSIGFIVWQVLVCLTLFLSKK